VYPDEVRRLVALGATVVARYEDVTVVQDPEGNEFCVEPGPDDRTETRAHGQLDNPIRTSVNRDRRPERRTP
jgi:hypothetical protein